jgi:hypothetical protein
MRYFITYGDEKFKVSRDRICRQATEMNIFNNVKCFTRSDIDEDFKNKIGKYFNEPRGGGLMLWKPYIIYKTLEKLNDGDFLVYCDAGCHLDLRGRSMFLDYFNLLHNKSCIQIVHPYKERDWTIRETYKYFNIELDNSLQKWSGCEIIKKCPDAMKIFGDWYRIGCERPDLFSLEYNDSNRSADPTFKYNRHDQSIISILSKLPQYITSVLVLHHYSPKLPKQVNTPPYYPVLASRDKQ